MLQSNVVKRLFTHTRFIVISPMCSNQPLKIIKSSVPPLLVVHLDNIDIDKFYLVK